MKFLRTVSTQRLLAILAGLVIAIAGGSAIAVAASSGGPVPRPEPLAQAVHGVLTAPSVQGISARITFTNNLIDASNIQGKDPLLQGASGRLWLSPSTHQLRLELQSDNGDAQAVVNNRSFWVYDPTSQTVYEGTLPAQSATAKSKDHKAKKDSLPSLKQIQTELNKLAQHTNLSGAIPSDVAGHAAYTVQVSPKHDGGLLGDAQMAWDAVRGVPLRFAVYARGSASPVIELKATDISFAKVPSSDFNISPPSGTKVVKVSTTGASQSRATSKARRAARHLGQHDVFMAVREPGARPTGGLDADRAGHQRSRGDRPGQGPATRRDLDGHQDAWHQWHRGHARDCGSQPTRQHPDGHHARR